jgi:hypothetical protein
MENSALREGAQGTPVPHRALGPKGIADLRSAKEGLPIDRVGGGPGFIWGQASTAKDVGFSDWPRWMYLDFFPRHQRNNQ